MELLDLKIFCDLVELKSFTEAASKNCLTQSAVSQRISRLNDYYANRLFVNKKQLTLSSHGKYLYEKFKDILNIYSHTEEIIEKRDLRPVISIGFSENAKTRYFNQRFLNDLFEYDFLPELYFGPSQSIYEKVLFGSLDYGIAGNRPQESNELICNKIYAENIVLATSAQHLPQKLNIKEIPIILDHRDSGLYQFIKRELLSMNIDIEQLNIKGYFGTSVDKFLLLQSGKFYSFLPEGYVAKRAGLRMVTLDFELTRSFYEMYQRKRVQKIAFLSERIRKYNMLET